MKHNFHEFRPNRKLKLQNNFIFIDTESDSYKKDKKTEILTFKLGCAIFWKRIENIIHKFTFFDINVFWNNVESMFNKDNKDIILFAHNTQFDFKMLDGFNQLIKRNWNLDSFYVKNRTFILVFSKQITNKLKYTLHCWDTYNFANKSLRELGLSIGCKKLEVDFKKVRLKMLEIYCKRDTFILYLFIRSIIKMLLEYDLTKLKATAGSLSFNCYRHKFYDYDNEQARIYIHDWKQCIKLERASYRGGITDCFKIGITKDIIKLDINSQYPFNMYNELLPNKLLFYSHESQYNQIELFKIYNLAKKNKFGVILNCTIELPKDKAYILNKFSKKSMFAYGIFKIAVCTPELQFIEQYGKILEIHEIAIYRMYPIFRKFIEFFNAKKIEYTLQDNKVYREITKLFMNTQYGKWAQKDIMIKKLDLKDNWLIKNQDLLLIMIKEKEQLIRNNSIVYLGKIINDSEIYIVNHELFRIKSLETNAKDSLIAISSFITSYSRMLLIKYLLIAKRKNVIYTDTDSLLVNKEGYKNLKKANLINETELGLLKNEGVGTAKIYAPKFYDFDNKRKIKGVNIKTAKLIKENKDKVKYEVELWNKFKMDLKNGNLNKQIITKTTKEVSKLYDKGKVLDNGYIEPFHVSEVI